MTNFDTLCTMAEDIPADLYREVLREKAGRVLPALEAAAGSRERAETVFAAFIIGLAAGLIGIGIAYALSAVISLILEGLTGIAGIASLPVTSAIVMVCVSVALTLVSGLIPAQSAAKKDPVIALRTE